MENIITKIESQIAIITINRPPANALSSVILKGLSETLEKLEKNENVKVMIIQGEGRFFSAGADIKEFINVNESAAFTQLGKYGQDLFERMERFPKPIIACIHGAALGGGLELAMACHIRIVSEDAKLGLPELQLGLIPGFAGTVRLPRYVGVAKAAEMLWTSEPITGREAVQWGIANHAFSEERLLDETIKIARKITKKSPGTISATIELLNLTKTENYKEVVNREAVLFGKLFSSEDGQEGIKAFIEKRQPNFKGK